MMKEKYNFDRLRFLTPDRIRALSLVLFFIIAGFTLGNSFGDYLIRKLITGNRESVFLLYRPALEYIYTARLLNSNNEFKRLAGYYSLIDNRKIDDDFLIERYNKESGIIMKRSIIWLLGHSENSGRVLEFLSGEYKAKSKRLKREILRAMKRLDKDFFNKFVKEKKVDIKFLESV